MPSPSTPFLVSLSQCGYELQGHQMVTRTKRMLQGEKLVLSALSRGTLRAAAYDPDAVRAEFKGLDPSADYALEVICVSEADTRRVQSITLGGTTLDRSIEVVPGPEVVTLVDVPKDAIVDGTLTVAIGRVEGPDAVVSELRLYSSVAGAAAAHRRRRLGAAASSSR